jgi:G patch domain-containing protein 1
MDEEDLQELRDSRTIVDTTEEMDLTAGTKGELQRRTDTEDKE